MYDVFNKRVYYYYYSYPDFIIACHQRAMGQKARNTFFIQVMFLAVSRGLYYQ